ncbi:hypothetical protein L5515_006155 [Caenorhabditis briggsae]|uniref:Uncharacterized protein n=1 Tax=Caenorhabditis briggsae TaxID=6238 RepID=A0AAE9JKJ5_CAEBR|nr:hypothetical protein L5515_006155 [Caenorhabditis briggsae]
MKQLAISFCIILPLACFWVLNAEDAQQAPELRDANSTVFRQKRQFGCPANCYSSCSSSSQCQRYSVSAVCVQGCCCPGNNNLDTACSGGPAVAACLGGLCGQGFFCSSNNYCCRCQSGNSTGPCVNQVCPTGFMCNTNNYCCPLGSGGVLGSCVNGVCPIGYTCGAGNLCYLSSGK